MAKVNYRIYMVWWVVKKTNYLHNRQIWLCICNITCMPRISCLGGYIICCYKVTSFICFVCNWPSCSCSIFSYSLYVLPSKYWQSSLNCPWRPCHYSEAPSLSHQLSGGKSGYIWKVKKPACQIWSLPPALLLQAFETHYILD